MSTRRDRSDLAFLDALADARALLEAGVPGEAALEAAPADQRADLAGALRVVARVASIEEAPASAFGAALESRLLETLDEARTVRGRRRGFLTLPMLWRVGAAAAAVVLAFGLSGFAAVQASERTIPGDALYPVKEAREAVAVLIARNVRDDSRVARAHLERLVARQRELEVALARDAPAEVVLTLERGVANAVNQSVQVSRRLEAAGNPAPAALALDAITVLHARIDELAALEDARAIALTLRRMSNFLGTQERLLRGEVPAPPQRPQPRPTDVRPTEARPTDVLPADVRPTDVRPTEERPLREAPVVPTRARPAATVAPSPARPR